MAHVPKQRKPGQTGNWSGHGKNVSAFNARQKAGKSKGCLLFLVAVIVFVSGFAAGIAGLA